MADTRLPDAFESAPSLSLDDLDDYQQVKAVMCTSHCDQCVMPRSDATACWHSVQLHVGEIDTSLMSRAKLKALVKKQVTPKKILLRDKLAFVTGTVMAL